MAALALAAAIAGLAAGGAASDAIPPVGAARSWGYQLQHVDPEILAPSPVDVLVIDHSRDGSDAGRLSPDEVGALKVKPDGSRRVVLSYLSIGEAEDYRHYWRTEWADSPPAWLGEENPDWPGNYAVRYWHEDWQGLVYGQPRALLDIIIAQGFDGVYLDRVDAYYGRSGMARKAMIGFVAALADYARARVPGFVIVQQNAEDLVADASHRSVIDGLAKEDLYYGVRGEGLPNPPVMVHNSTGYLDVLKQAGKPVFVVEYDLDAAARSRARAAAHRAGFLITFATRPLDIPPAID